MTTKTTAAPLAVIDWTRCDGHGLCSRLAPGSIAMAEDGFPILRPGPLSPAQEMHVRRAASACPALALRIE